MRAIEAVFGLSRGHEQSSLHLFDVQIQQECAMKNQKMLLSPLCVPIELQSSNRQVRMAADFYWRPEQICQGGSILIQYICIGGVNAAEGICLLDFEDERII